tara:strand:+ start:294 stop:518 length:225 start_codon:yes stop_codon:yes gene_type:complete
MNKIKLIDALQALRYLAYIAVVMPILIVVMGKGFSMLDEREQIYVYVLSMCFLVTPHVVHGYTALLNLFSSDKE